MRDLSVFGLRRRVASPWRGEGGASATWTAIGDIDTRATAG
jgi:hypothetical protein